MISEVLLEPSPTLSRIDAKFKLVLDVEKPNLEKDHEYIDYALSVLERTVDHPLHGSMSNDLECGGDSLNKSEDRAEYFQLLGNNLFKDGSMAEALYSYTLGIAFAEPGSTQLGLAYGNRSAVLFHKHYYKECLEDIERALKINYPEEEKDKLVKRQLEAKKLLPTQKKVTYHDAVPEIPIKNTNISSASDSITINESEQYGRHIVATRNINPGEIILVEKPYTCFVSPYDNSPTYCSECSELCYNPIPCKKCAGVLYCSKDCRRNAFVAYHRYECAIVRTFGYNDVIDWNATRMTLKAIKEYSKKGSDNTAEYRSDRYLEFSILSYYKGDNLQDTLVTKAAGAAKVFYALKNYTDIFSELDMDDEENFLKGFLFKNVCIRNRHSSAVEMSCGPIDKRIGSGMYSVFALFNHVCAENVARTFYGATMVLKATKPIRKGEQCFLNYDGLFPMKYSVQERQDYFQNYYYFTCKCMACEHNWPIATESSDDPAVSSLCAINSEVVQSENLSEQQKSDLLEKTIQAAEKAEPKSPYLSHVYCHSIYKRILFDGNRYTSF